MTNNIPPKQTPIQSAGAPETPGFDGLPPVVDGGLPGAQPGALVSIHDPALHGDASAFPVLKAFQDYLETERQQARKRLVTLTAFFVCLMALVVGGFIVAFIFLFNRMSQQQDVRQESTARMQEMLLQAALQQRAAPVQPAPAAPPAIEATVRQFESAAMNLQTNLGARLDDVGDTTLRLNAKLDTQNKEMAQLQSSLVAIRQENQRLRDDMPRLALAAARQMPPPAEPVATAAPAAVRTARAHAAAASGAAPIASTAGTPAATAGSPVKGYSESLLLVRSRTGDEAIPWHALIPE